MNEAEIGAIMVRLTGDGSQYQKMLAQAKQATKEAEEQILSAKNHIDGFGRALSRWAEIAVAGLALNTLRNFLSESLNAWSDQENAIIKLEAVLESNGRNVEEMSRIYGDASGEMQNLTTMADEVTLALYAQAESFDLTGAAARRAVQDAIGFAAVNGGNAESYLRFTAAMARGDTERMKMMARMIPQLRGIKNETELMEKAQKLAAVGFETAQRLAGTLTGRLSQLKNAWGDIMEDIGQNVASFLGPFVNTARAGVDFLKSFSPELKTVATGVLIFAAALASIGPLVAVYKVTLLPLFTMTDDGFRLMALAVKTVINPVKVLNGLFIALKFTMLKLSGVIGFIFGPWGLVLGAIAIAIGMIVDHFGGLKETFDVIKATGLGTWDAIKQATRNFLDWFRPIWKAVSGVVSAAWENIKYVVYAAIEAIKPIIQGLKNFIGMIWNSITGGTKISWQKVRDTIIEALIAAEFMLKNFGGMWEAFTAATAVRLVRIAHYLQYAFQTVPEKLFKWFKENHERLWTEIKAHAEISAGVVGELLADALKPAAEREGAEAIIDRGRVRTAAQRLQSELQPFVMPTIVTSELEKELQAAEDKIKRTLSTSYQAFRAARLKEINKAREEAGLGPIADELQQERKAVESEVRKMDAVLRGSAEAFSRILKHLEMVRGGPRVNRLAGATSTTPVATPSAAQANSAEAQRRQLTLTELIEQHLREIRRRPGLNIEPAGL